MNTYQQNNGRVMSMIQELKQEIKKRTDKIEQSISQYDEIKIITEDGTEWIHNNNNDLKNK